MKITADILSSAKNFPIPDEVMRELSAVIYTEKKKNFNLIKNMTQELDKKYGPTK